MKTMTTLMIVCALSVSAADKTQTNDPQARALLESTRNAKGWDAAFHGFRANIEVLHGGTQHQGKVLVTREARVTLEGISNEGARQYAQQALASIVMHSLQRDFNKGDGRHGITFGDDDGSPLGRKVIVHGDAYKSWYRIRDGQLTQVNRTMGTQRFTIDMLSVERDAEGRRSRQSFVVNTWNNSGAWVKNEAFRDESVVIGAYALPRQRYVITTEPSKPSYVHAITLSGHQLLTEPAR